MVGWLPKIAVNHCRCTFPAGSSDQTLMLRHCLCHVLLSNSEMSSGGGQNLHLRVVYPTSRFGSVRPVA